MQGPAAKSATWQAMARRPTVMRTTRSECLKLSPMTAPTGALKVEQVRRLNRARPDPRRTQAVPLQVVQGGAQLCSDPGASTHGLLAPDLAEAARPANRDGCMTRGMICRTA